VSQVQIAGARIVIDCKQQKATGIFIGASFDEAGEPNRCDTDDDCPGKRFGQCDVDTGICWQSIEPFGAYELATSNYLAGGGSGFRVLHRNTTQFDTKVQQRDALIDYIRGGNPCGSSKSGELRACSKDADCGCEEGGDPSLCNAEKGTYVCACPETAVDGATCSTDPDKSCGGKGACVLAALIRSNISTRSVPPFQPAPLWLMQQKRTHRSRPPSLRWTGSLPFGRPLLRLKSLRPTARCWLRPPALNWR
jgi:5'-nucleotidase